MTDKTVPPARNGAAEAIRKLIADQRGPVLSDEEHAAGYGDHGTGYSDGLNAALRATAPHTAKEG